MIFIVWRMLIYRLQKFFCLLTFFFCLVVKHIINNLINQLTQSIYEKYSRKLIIYKNKNVFMFRMIIIEIRYHWNDNTNFLYERIRKEGIKYCFNNNNF